MKLEYTAVTMVSNYKFSLYILVDPSVHPSPQGLSSLNKSSRFQAVGSFPRFPVSHFFFRYTKRRPCIFLEYFFVQIKKANRFILQWQKAWENGIASSGVQDRFQNRKNVVEHLPTAIFQRPAIPCGLDRPKDPSFFEKQYIN